MIVPIPKICIIQATLVRKKGKPNRPRHRNKVLVTVLDFSHI